MATWAREISDDGRLIEEVRGAKPDLLEEPGFDGLICGGDCSWRVDGVEASRIMDVESLQGGEVAGADDDYGPAEEIPTS